MVHNVHSTLFFVLLNLVNFGSHLNAGVGADESRALPSIWSNQQDGRGDTEQQFYHFMSEIQLLNSGKIFVVEEWASSLRQMFRLDVIESKTGRRNTILANKKTGEIFHYEQFKCSLAKDIKEALVWPELDDKFPAALNQHSFVPTGIGSLWLYASGVDSEYIAEEAELDSHSGENKTAVNVLKNFNKFTVQATDNYPYRLNFYFRSKITEYPESLALIHLERSATAGANRLQNTVMQVKMLRTVTSLKTATLNSDQDISAVFDLPVGYGCKRADKFDDADRSKFAAPVNILAGAQSTPHILQMDIVSLQPTDLSSVYDNWKTHTSSVRLVVGRLSLDKSHTKDYIVSETQDYSPEWESPKLYGTETRRATLRRVKRVWDLGEGVLAAVPAGESGNKSEYKNPMVAVYFEHDERTRKCLSYGERKLDENANIEIPVSLPVERLKSKNNTSSHQKHSPAIAGLTLDTEMIQTLFSSPYGYHLLKEESNKPVTTVTTGGSISTNRCTEFTYERRISAFEMRSRPGRIIWWGPVSIVRKHTLCEANANLKSEKKSSTGVRQLQTSITMLFFSFNLDQIVMKTHLEVSELKLINQAYFHRELDLSSCFNNMPTKSSFISRNVDSKDMEKSVPFTMNYPIESKDLADRLVASDQIEASLYEQFLSTLFAVSNSRLDALQIVDIGIDFGPEMMKISGTLLNRPSLLDYREEAGQKFPLSQRSSLFTEFKPNEESCAESCNHYNCPVFAYCSLTSACDLLMMEEGDHPQQVVANKQESILMDPDPNCSVFRRRDASKLRYITPIELVHKLRETILAQSEESAPEVNRVSCLLSLEAKYRVSDGSTQRFNLTPSSIESGLYNDAVLEDVSNGDNIEGLAQVIYKATNELKNNLLRPEYGLVFENRKYKSMVENVNKEQFPLQPSKHMTYKDCESLCDETDCRSFSHCQIEQECLVSQLHETTLIEQYTEKEVYCVVMARDYLSKFKKLSVQVDTDKLDGLKASKSLRTRTSRDCANQCMEEESFKCRAFYYCTTTATISDQPQLTGGPDNCHLRKSHTLATSISGQEDRMRPETKMGGGRIAGNSTTTCDLYTRSFLAQFDKFYGKSLPDQYANQWAIVLRGLGAENCAVECAERNGDCQAFHVCRHHSDGVSSHEPTCAVLEQQVSANVDHQPALTVDELIDDENCTTFVVSQSSELSLLRLNNSQKFKLVDGDDDETMSSATETNASGKSLIFCFVLGNLIVGLAIGYLVAFAAAGRCREHCSR